MVIYLFVINGNLTSVVVHQEVGFEEVFVDKLSNYAVLVFYYSCSKNYRKKTGNIRTYLDFSRMQFGKDAVLYKGRFAGGGRSGNKYRDPGALQQLS